MTTMSDVVGKAAHLLGIAKRSQQPTGYDAADLLAQAQGVLTTMLNPADQPWTDVFLTSDAAYEAGDGERIAVEGFNPVITLPTSYVDDCGTTRIMEDFSRVHVIGDGQYVWSSTLAAWNKFSNLAAGDTFPLGPEDLLGFVAAVAIAAYPEYTDADLKPVTYARAEAMLKRVSARIYREVVVPADLALLRLSNTGHRGSYA